MFITKSDAISVGQVLQGRILSEIKNLDQEERKFVLEAIKVAESEDTLSMLKGIRQDLSTVSEEMGGGEAIKSDPAFYVLKGRIENSLKKPLKYNRSSFFMRIFKGLANIFCRVSSARIMKAVAILSTDQNYKKYLKSF